MRRDQEILKQLKSHANPANVAGMARFGINPEGALGVSIAVLRPMARQIGRDHALAARLWASGVHEARILATLIDDPAAVSRAQMNRWVRDLDSWDVCDQLCNNLFVHSPYAHTKAAEWSRRRGEFVKRAGFTLMAVLAVHDKDSGNGAFIRFFPLIRAGAGDERHYVKKAVNWALRQIGKRNGRLHARAVKTAEAIAKIDARSARWIAASTLRELKSEKVRAKLRSG